MEKCIELPQVLSSAYIIVQLATIQDVASESRDVWRNRGCGCARQCLIGRRCSGAQYKILASRPLLLQSLSQSSSVTCCDLLLTELQPSGDAQWLLGLSAFPENWKQARAICSQHVSLELQSSAGGTSTSIGGRIKRTLAEDHRIAR